MFQRRNKVPLTRKIREAIWPQAGWRRMSLYVFKRLLRLRGSSYSLASGFAIGAAVSFTPFVGLHFIISAAIAWVMRANVMAALIGTAVGNPWTFPFIWVWIYNAGVWMGVGRNAQSAQEVNFSDLFDAILDAAMNLEIAYLVETSWPLWGPMLAGSVPTAIVVWLAFYIPMKWAIETYRDRHKSDFQRVK